MQPMGQMSCQSCGAQSPIPPGQPFFTCPYCKVSYQLNAPPPPPPPPPDPFQSMGYGGAPPNLGYGPPPGAPMPHFVVAPPRTKSSGVIGIVLAVLLLPIIIGGFVVSIIFLRGQSEWDGTETLECAGNDEMTVSDITSNVSGGPSIIADGNCTLHVKQCNLKGSIGIQAGGNAHVTVDQGSVEGTESSIDASGNARVDLHGTKVTGPKTRNANAKITGP
jgi:hypothetical protein